MLQPPKLRQNIQIRQLRNRVRRQHEVLQVGNRIRDIRLDRRNPIAREQQRRDARREREVAQRVDLVVGEVDAV